MNEYSHSINTTRRLIKHLKRTCMAIEAHCIIISICVNEYEHESKRNPFWSVWHSHILLRVIYLLRLTLSLKWMMINRSYRWIWSRRSVFQLMHFKCLVGIRCSYSVYVNKHFSGKRRWHRWKAMEQKKKCTQLKVNCKNIALDIGPSC